MKTTGYNSLKSWGILIACSIIFCLITLPYKTFAFFYVAFLDRFDTSRENASLFMVVSLLLSNLLGPVTGFFCEILGIRGLTMVGCFISALGVGICFFAENMITVNVFMGLIYGVGLTMGAPLLPQAIKQHFDKNIANANGVFRALSAIATFCIIPLVSFILNTYELSGALLLTGGIMFHAVPFAMLLRDPKYKKIPPEDVLKDLMTADTNPNNHQASNTNSNGMGKLLSESSSTIEDCELKNYTESENVKDTHAVSLLNNQDSNAISIVNEKLLSDNYVDVSIESDDCTLQSNGEFKDCGEQEIRILGCSDEKSQLKTTNTLHPLLINESCTNTTLNHESLKPRSVEKTNKFRQAVKTLTVLKDPSFLVIMICQSVHGYVTMVVFIIVVDYSRDKNIDKELEQYLIMSFTIFPIVGYMCLGWLIDKGYIKIANFMAICFVILGLSCFAMVLSNSFLTLILSTAGFGIFVATLYSSIPCLIYEFIDEKKQTMAVSAGAILQAPLSFTMAPLLGYFRGKLGSYDGALYILTGGCLGCGLLLILLPLISKCSKKRNKRTSCTASS